MTFRRRIRPASFVLAGIVTATAVATAGFPGTAGALAPTATPAPPDPVSGLIGALAGPPDSPADPAAGRIGAPKPAELPLGRAGLRERRSTEQLAPGITLTTIRRGEGKAKRKRFATTPTGPWEVNVLTIDPREAEGQLTTTFGRNLADLDRTTALARQASALAGVNGSFFSLRGDRRYPGLPVGLTISDGRVLSRPTGTSQEVTLALDSADNALHIGRYAWTGTVRSRSGHGALTLSRVNSPPGVPRGCALRKAAAKPRCAGTGQLAEFTRDFGGRTPKGPGVEVVLDGDGCPVRVAPRRGVRLAGTQTSLQATGATGLQLRRLIAAGCVDTEQSVRNRPDGAELPLHAGVSAITGRYRLVRDGATVLHNRRSSLFGRNPRTIVGTDSADRLMLVTIDGRQPRSVGATLWEAARVARALGMQDAINLDGGGSTAMAVDGRLVSHPSDATGERPVGDAIYIR